MPNQTIEHFENNRCQRGINAYLGKSWRLVCARGKSLPTYYHHGYKQKRLHVFLRWVFIGKFSQQTKVPWFKVVFHLANSFDLNVSAQVFLFPLNLVSGLL